LDIDAARKNGGLVNVAVLGGCLMLGLILGGWVLGYQIKETKLSVMSR
jgi:hypothetical protein